MDHNNKVTLTEDDIENILDPLDIDDILVKPTSNH